MTATATTTGVQLAAALVEFVESNSAKSEEELSES